MQSALRFVAVSDLLIILLPDRGRPPIKKSRAMEMLLEHGVAVDFEQRLHKRLGGRVRNLRVLRRDGQVVLSGSSHSFYVKQLATHAMMELGPTEELVNEIIVDPRS